MSDKIKFIPHEEVLSLEEYLRLVKVFVSMGVTKVRVTGGEPLMRKNAIWFLSQISSLPGLNEVVITTNGSQLEHQAHSLRRAGVSRLNISLDSLDKERFKQITRVGSLEKVLRGIAAAKKEGFKRIKLNTILMRGINDDESVSLVSFAIREGLDISFIEEMPLGKVGHNRALTYVNNDSTLAVLRENFTLIRSAEHTGGPARYWQIPGTETKVGFISPHSHNFCDSCNRLRVSCRGELFPCLGQEGKVELDSLLREYPFDDSYLKQAILRSIESKPIGHDFNNARDQSSVIRFMSYTGG
jgi:cyclic pyranopterin phosphate synthase